MVATRFNEEEFTKLCDICRTGDRAALENMLSTLSTTKNDINDGKYSLCPDAKLHVSSPLVLASQFGHLPVLVHLLIKFKHEIDINQGATIISRTTKKKVHCATPLWAASTGGHLEIVEFLISKGADVNKTTLTRSTPLRGASFHGHIKVMELLLANGADLNMPNCVGQSPLCIAAMRGETEAVEFLLKRGADRTQCTINGYTIMHLAAAKGKDEVIKLFLEHGISPMFQVANPFLPDYVPCPLFLAASTGQNKAVEVLVEREDCPEECKADAYLLLAAMHCELRRKLRVVESRIRDLWEKGLKIRRDNNIKPIKLRLKEYYQFQDEIQTFEELDSLWHIPSFSKTGVFYQSLMIRERCMGFLDQGLVYFLIRRGTYFSQDGYCKEAELLWKQAMEMELTVCEVDINHGVYGHCESILRDLEKDLTMFVSGIQNMLEEGYEPAFTEYIKYGIKEIDILGRLSNKADAELITNEILIGIVLELFLTWINCHMSNGNNKPSSSNSFDKYFWPAECEELGREFVAKYLYFKEGTTLLHHTLTNFELSDSSGSARILYKFTDTCPLVAAILSWGGYLVIDQPDCNGLRPIHIAAMLSDDEVDHELLSSLIMAGVHVDAVDKDGRRALDVCAKTCQRIVLRNTGPSSLYCLSAMSVVCNNIDYSSLPTHVQNFIGLHDKNKMCSV